MRRRASGAALILTAIVATGCGSSTLTSRDIDDRYAPVVRDLEGALAPLVAEPLSFPDPKAGAAKDLWGRCEGWVAATSTGLQRTAPPAAESIRDAVRPVLQRHGFGEPDGGRQVNALFIVTAKDARGARVELLFGGNVGVSVRTAVASSECR